MRGETPHVEFPHGKTVPWTVFPPLPAFLEGKGTVRGFTPKTPPPYEKEERKQKKYDLWQYYHCPKSDLAHWLESEFKIPLNELMSIGIIEKRMTKAGFNCIIKESAYADLINDDNDESNPF